MERLFTYGYARGSLRDLDRFVEQGALIGDVRFNPFSERREWGRDALRERYGADYRWFRKLGNVRYRTGGIEIADLEPGLHQLRAHLQKRPVVLLCGCEHWHECHRTWVAIYAAHKFPGLEWFGLPPGFDLDGLWIEDQM